MVARSCKTIKSCDPMFSMALLFKLWQLRGSLAWQRIIIHSWFGGNMLCNMRWHLGVCGISAMTSNSHYDDVIMDTVPSQITSLAIVYPIVYSSADQRKHQSSASLAFVWGIHRGPVNSPHKGPVTRKMFPFDDAIMGINSFNHALISIQVSL